MAVPTLQLFIQAIPLLVIAIHLPFLPGPPSIDTNNQYFQYDNCLHEQSSRIVSVEPYRQSSVASVSGCLQNDVILTAIPVSNELVDSGISYQSLSPSSLQSPYNSYAGQAVSPSSLQSPYNSYTGQAVSPSSSCCMQPSSPYGTYYAQPVSAVTVSCRDDNVYQLTTQSDNLVKSEGGTLYNVKPYTISMLPQTPVKPLKKLCEELMKETRRIIEARYKRDWTSKPAKRFFDEKVQKKWNSLAVKDLSVEEKYMKYRLILVRMMKCLDEDSKSSKLWRWVNGAQLVIDVCQIKLTKVYSLFSKGMNDMSYAQILRDDESIKIYICIILDKYDNLPGYTDPLQLRKCK